VCVRERERESEREREREREGEREKTRERERKREREVVGSGFRVQGGGFRVEGGCLVEIEVEKRDAVQSLEGQVRQHPKEVRQHLIRKARPIRQNTTPHTIH